MSVCPHAHTDLHVTFGNGGVPPVVHYWANSQSAHEFHCYNNIARMQNVRECSLLALCLVNINCCYTI